MHFLSYTPSSQKGIALIISLIVLLLLTLIGVSGMQITGLEEKMANNDRDRSIAFQAAEVALRAGQSRIEQARNNGTGSIQQFCKGSVQNVPGFYNAVGLDNKTSIDTDPMCLPCTNACAPPDPMGTAAWTGTASIEVSTGNTVLDAQLASKPRYFITYIETHLGDNASDLPTYTFTVTAHGAGTQPGSTAVLRSYMSATTQFVNY